MAFPVTLGKGCQTTRQLWPHHPYLYTSFFSGSVFTQALQTSHFVLVPILNCCFSLLSNTSPWHHTTTYPQKCPLGYFKQDFSPYKWLVKGEHVRSSEKWLTVAEKIIEMLNAAVTVALCNCFSRRRDKYKTFDTNIPFARMKAAVSIASSTRLRSFSAFSNHCFFSSSKCSADSWLLGFIRTMRAAFTTCGTRSAAYNFTLDQITVHHCSYMMIWNRNVTIISIFVVVVVVVVVAVQSTT